MLGEILVGNRDRCVLTLEQEKGQHNRQPRTMFTQESDEGSVSAPYNVLDRRGGNLCNGLLLLNVV